MKNHNSLEKDLDKHLQVTAQGLGWSSGSNPQVTHS